MDYNKVRKICRVIRIAVGLALIITGVIQMGAVDYAPWFFLGFLPLIAGLVNFCPICIISKKCDIPDTGSSK